MNPQQRVLVLFINTPQDLNLARSNRWFRMRAKHSPKHLDATTVAFYQPSSFGDDRWVIRFMASLEGVTTLRRRELLPKEEKHPRAEDLYYRLELGPIQELARPIRSQKASRFVFRETTWWRFSAAESYEELFSDDPLIPKDDNMVLVAVVNRQRDMDILRRHGWYRIPVSSYPTLEASGYLAFYQTRVFGAEGSCVRYYARMFQCTRAKRLDLLPEEPDHPRAQKYYWQIHTGPLERLSAPITSRRQRRPITFIPTTLSKLLQAADVNDLYMGHPAEEDLWTAIKNKPLEAERQYRVRGTGAYDVVDFALFAQKGNVAVSTPVTEGDEIEMNTELNMEGWDHLVFPPYQLAKRMPDVMEKIRQAVDERGGMLTG